MENKLLWWGYVHTNESFHIKRYFGESDIIEATESPFVQNCYGPFWAKNREEASNKLEKFKNGGTVI